MDHELPPNKLCRKCGAENLATASHCLQCAAPLRAGSGPREEVLRIDGKTGPSLPPRGGFPWRGLFRVMAAPGCASLAFTVYPTIEGKSLAAVAGFVASGILAIVTAVATDVPPGGRPPHGGWSMVDVLLRVIGCVFSALAALGISLFAFFLAMCYCGNR